MNVLVLWLMSLSPLLKSLYFYVSHDIKLQGSGVFLCLAVHAFFFAFIINKTKISAVWWTVGNFLFSCLLLVESLYFRYFGLPFSIESFRYAHQLGEIQDGIFALIQASDGVWFIDLLLCVPFFLFKRVNLSLTVPFIFKKIFYVLSFGFITGTVLYLNLPNSDQKLSAPFSSKHRFRSLSMMPYHVLEAFDLLTRQIGKARLSDAEVNVIQNLLNRAQDNTSLSTPIKRNVILVQIEAMESFLVDLRVDGQEVMPFFNSLSKRGTLYPYMLDQTAGGRTSDAELVVLNSLLPSRRGAASYRFRNNDFMALPHIFKKSGYSTFSMHTNDISFWNRKETHPAYGFEKSLFGNDWLTYKGDFDGHDSDFFRVSVDFLSRQKQPFFAFLITISTHLPFKLPEKLIRHRYPKIQSEILRNYLESFNYFDSALSEFFNALENSGLLKNTVIVLYGDHDAGLGNNPEYMALRGNLPAGFDFVPLLIYGNGAKSPVTKKPVGMVDLAPTLLELLNLNRHPHAFLGESILGEPSSIITLRGGNFVTPSCFCGASLHCRPWNHKPPDDSCVQGQSQNLLTLKASQLILEHNLVKRLIAH